MPRCFETFCESGLSGQPLQRLVNDVHPGFACELETCSPFSPGPVEDDEDVAFLLINPLHYDEVRETIVPDAFQELINRDLSVIRTTYATDKEADATRDELIARGLDRIPPSLRLVNEVCIGSVRKLREPTPGDRMFAVYDTALNDKPAHASVFVASKILDAKQLRKQARARIHSIMTARRLNYDDFKKSLKS